MEQGHVVQVLLADYSILKAVSTDNGLQLRDGTVRIAGKGMEDNLVQRYSCQEGYQDVQVFGELVLRLVHSLLVWRS